MSYTVQKRSFTRKNSGPTVGMHVVSLATPVRYPEYFRVPQDDPNASRTGALVLVKICKQTWRVVIFAYLRKPKSTDRPSERASRQ